MNRPNHKSLSAEIHQSNVDAGWWTNLETGERLNRNFGEMIALIHSELSECWQGIAAQCPDTHLTKLPMYQVEIADACIRVYDLLGGYFSDNLGFIPFPLDVPEGFISYEDRLVYFHLLISEALENYRKSKRAEAKMYLWRFLDACFELADEDGFDLLDIINQKVAYNRERADHKIENRLKDGGKKI